MKLILYILPVALLISYGQLIAKWRTTVIHAKNPQANDGPLVQILTYLSDPLLLSSYAAALIGSFAWLFVVSKLPLNIAFPAYIGVTVGLVLLGSHFFLGEPLTGQRMLALALIVSGIIVGSRSA